jgi:cell division protein FtsZ
LSTIRPPALKLQIGDKITKGLGAGSNPDIGEQAALDDTGQIIEVLEGAHMVFITAGMGGGTGTGASHVIANHASTMGILTVAVVSKPFHFEKEKRMRVAEEGIRKLKENVDAIIVIPNQKLLELGDANITYKNAYKKADEVLLQAVRGISDIISSTGAQNVDFADVKATMVGKGITLMGTGEAKGDNRGEEAANRALNSPLLDNLAINGATGILFNITASSSLTLAEIEKISELITKNADSDATIKFGVIEDENAGDTLRVTVIATGFKEGRSDAPGRAKTPSPNYVPIEPAFRQPTPGQLFLGSNRPGSGGADLRHYVNDSNMPNMTHGPESFEDPLDIPTFQRLNPIKKK